MGNRDFEDDPPSAGEATMEPVTREISATPVPRETTDRAAARGERVTSGGIRVEREPRGSSHDPVDASRLLAQASAVLAGSSDHESSLRSMLELTIPPLADWAILDLLGDGSRFRRAVVVRASTEPRDLESFIRARLPRPDDTSDPIARVLGGGDAELLPRIDDDARARLALSTAGRDLVERLAPEAWITVPLRVRGQPIGALTFITSRSGRHFHRRDLVLARQLADRAALVADNARLLEQARRADEARSSFLAIMSHELRTPLTAILGYTELMTDGLFGPVTDEQRLQLARVRESGEHLLRIIEELLDFARSDVRRVCPSVEETEVGAVIDQTATLVRPLAERKGLALRVETPPEPMRWWTDPGRVRHILVNLLGNAVKFTERGEIRLRGSVRGDTVLLEVQDTGIGIADHMHDRVFEPFWQAEPHLTRPRPGTGLGLSVARQLAELLGGTVEVRSVLGEGSTFTVRLPLRLEARPAVDCATTESSA